MDQFLEQSEVMVAVFFVQNLDPVHHDLGCLILIADVQEQETFPMLALPTNSTHQHDGTSMWAFVERLEELRHRCPF
jgi:hypothetical protein